MCEAMPDRFNLLGLRLNQSQGKKPKAASGIAVSVKQCGECGLIFADPLPIPESMADHYGLPPESYWTTNSFEVETGYFAREVAEAKRLINFQPGMTALDVGVGLGKSMAVMAREGFDVRGIEPSAPFRDRALSFLDVSENRVVAAGIEDAEFGGGQFNFITFGAVLEHIYDPAAALEKCLRWLKPGGVIQAEVPSSAHLMSKLLNQFFRLAGTNYVTNISPMHSPFHLYEFTPRSFESHGARAGYEIASQYYSVGSIYHLPKFVHAPLKWMMERNATGMQLTVFLRKLTA